MIRCPACGALNRPEADGCVVCGVALGGDLANLGRDTLTAVPSSLRARLQEAIAQGEQTPAPSAAQHTLYGRAPAGPDSSTATARGPGPGDATLYGAPALRMPAPSAPEREPTPDPFAGGPTPDPLRQTHFGRPIMPAPSEVPADPFEPVPGERTTPGRPGPATPASPVDGLTPADLRRTQYGMPSPFVERSASPSTPPPAATTTPPPRGPVSSASVPPVRLGAPPSSPSLPPVATGAPPAVDPRATLYGRVLPVPEQPTIPPPRSPAPAATTRPPPQQGGAQHTLYGQAPVVQARPPAPAPEAAPPAREAAPAHPPAHEAPGPHATLFGRPLSGTDSPPVEMRGTPTGKTTQIGVPPAPQRLAPGPTPAEPAAAIVPRPVAVPAMPQPPRVRDPKTPLIQEAQVIAEQERGRWRGRLAGEPADAPHDERAPAPAEDGPDDGHDEGPEANDVAPVGRPEGADRPSGRDDGYRMGRRMPDERAEPAGGVDPRTLDAARFGLATEAQERTAARTRIRWASMLLVLVGLGAAAAAWYIHQQQVAFHAEMAGPHTVTHRGGAYSVEVGVTVSEPAEVTSPGGTQRVEGASRVRFTVPTEQMKVGANELALTARPIAHPEAARTLVLRVLVHYRLRTEVIPPPQPGVPIKAHVEVMPDWQLTVEGAQTESIAANTYEVRVDPGPLLSRVDTLTGDEAELPLPLTLTGPDGAEQTFRETLRVPLPSTPVVLFRPPHNQVVAADRLVVGGAAVPGARVTVAGVEAPVDARGRFEIEVPLAAPGAHSLEVIADGPSKRPGVLTLSVERLTEAAYRAAAAAVSERFAREKPAGSPPPYAALRDDPDAHKGTVIALKGALLHAARGRTAGLDAVQIATCRTGSRCVVWVDLKGPLLAQPGDVVQLIGRLDGTTRYQTRAGEALVVPRVQAEVLVP